VKIAVASCGKLWHCKRHKFCDYSKEMCAHDGGRRKAKESAGT
jgi:hypothetical protein